MNLCHDFGIVALAHHQGVDPVAVDGRQLLEDDWARHLRPRVREHLRRGSRRARRIRTERRWRRSTHVET